MKQFDDELIDLVPAKPQAAPSATVAATVQPAPQQQAAAQAAPAPQPQAAPASRMEVDDIDIPHQQHQPQQGGSKAAASKEEAADFAGEEVDWGDAEIMKRGDGLDRIRPEKKSDKVIRLALLPFLGRPHGCRTHFVATREGKRQYVCMGRNEGTPPRIAFIPGLCCKHLDEEGRYHCISLALQYTNSDPDVLDPRSGNYAKGYSGPIEFKIGFLDLSRPNFRSVTNLIEEGASIYDYDLVMVLNGNKYEFHIKARTPRWRTSPELAKAVEEACHPFVQDGGRKLYRRLGKRLSILEWKALLSGLAAGAARPTWTPWTTYKEPMDRKYLDARTLVDGGYLQEANRQFFHPLGLALALEDGALRVWDCRDDPEGICFADGLPLRARPPT